MTTYTIIGSRGELIARGLTVRETAIEILTAAGREFEIRYAAEDDRFFLWSRRPLSGIGWYRTPIWSSRSDMKAAETEIFEDVVESRTMFGCENVVLTDEEYRLQKASAKAS